MRVWNFIKAPVIFTAMVFVLLSGLFDLDSSGRIGGGVGLLSHGLRAITVEPFGLPATMAMVFAVFLGIKGMMYMSSNGRTEPDDYGEHDNYFDRVMREREAEKEAARMQALSGTGPSLAERQAAEAAADAVRREARRPQREKEGAEAALRDLRTRSLDWFFAHYLDGYEPEIVAGLHAAGHHALAAIVAEAGEVWLEAQRVAASREEGEMTQDETTAYFAKMRPLDDRVAAYFSQRRSV